MFESVLTFQQTKRCQYQTRTVTNADHTATQVKEDQKRLQNCTELKTERGVAILKHDMHAGVPRALTTPVACLGNVRLITFRLITFRLGFERLVARERTNRVFRQST